MENNTINKKCQYCASDINSEAIFCQYCGKDLRLSVDDFSKNEARKDQSQKAVTTAITWFGLLIALGFLADSCGGVW